MRAARSHRYDTTLEGPGCSIREDVPDPTMTAPGAGVVTIEGAGACRTNLPIIEGPFSDQIAVALLIPGYEHDDSVIAVGIGTRRARSGASVIIPPPITDATCHVCRLGQDTPGERDAFQHSRATENSPIIL